MAVQKFSCSADDKSTTEIIFNTCRTLSNSGHNITICTTNHKLDTQKIKDLEQYGVKFFIAKILVNIGGFIITPKIICSLSTIRQSDIIHLHNYRTFQNVIIAAYARLYKIPYILQAEGSLTTYYQKKYSKALFDHIFGYRMIHNATKVIAASEQESKQYLRLGVPKENIVTIPFAIDIDDYAHLPEKGLFKRKYNINPNRKIILYLGRIHQRKGLNILLSAFFDLKKDNLNAILVVAGPDDGYLVELCSLIDKLKLKDSVITPGPLYNSDKLEAYIDADIFILPSFHDDFGLTALESLACGTPVIITDRCGASDVVHKNGGLVINYDKNSLTNGIKSLLSDDDLRIKYSKSGKTMVNSSYSWDSIGKVLEACYKSCSSKIMEKHD